MIHVTFTGTCVPGGNLDVALPVLPPLGAGIDIGQHCWRVSGLPKFDVGLNSAFTVVHVPVEPREDAQDV
jgi:hypothetical protein